ncbi:MAG TPA: Gfo/Idh/MocA family oxidoreductase [Vicinamibacteria bacterium]|nr:Gfo/Idh/MocA family oxidoreductase [Vicinamibacteria bacterium]
MTSRRAFVKAAGAAAAALSLGPAAAAQPRRLRYALVGTGQRGTSMWGAQVLARYADRVEFVGLADRNPLRLETARKMLGLSCPTFTSFEKMLDEARPDLVAVNTIDAYHADCIEPALGRGVRVVTEKPMVIDEQQCARVLAAEKKAGGGLVVAMNYRYTPMHTQVKEVLLSGELGRVISVDFDWYLDVDHGADYFRRWHRLKSQGGSLWVHKASHHFDLVNWWLGADPVEVYARGSLEIYGRKGPFRFTHCRPCPHKARCDFHTDITKDPRKVQLYVNAESADGYHRDGCVYREDVDIHDTMAATVTYSSGVHMSYSLNAFMPFEGHRVAFNCEKGRLEVRHFDTQPWQKEESVEFHVTPSRGQRREVPSPIPPGGHWGGDPILLDTIFAGAERPPHLRLPDGRAGAFSCLVGIAAFKSVEERRPVRIEELVRL